MTAHLFSPIAFGHLELANRIMVSPMCMYSAADGVMTDWHMMHLGQFAIGGAGIAFIEATAVTAEGRITPGCPGLWNDAQEAALARIASFFKEHGATRLGIQLGHAGRKGSTNLPWLQPAGLIPPQQGGWQPVAPSAIPHVPGDPEPHVLTLDEISRLVDAFAQAAIRAVRAGVDAVEMHMAHGYLMHQFLSPVANQRTDQYGGSLENRMRVLLEVFRAVRSSVPSATPVGVRLSAVDYIDGGLVIDDTCEVAKALVDAGCNFIDVSSGGFTGAKISPGPAYQLSFATRIREATGRTIPISSVGGHVSPKQAERIIAEGRADMLCLGRAMLSNPRWPWLAARALGAEIHMPRQYGYAVGPTWRELMQVPEEV